MLQRPRVRSYSALNKEPPTHYSGVFNFVGDDQIEVRPKARVWATALIAPSKALSGHSTSTPNRDN